MSSIEKLGMTFEDALAILARAQHEYNALGSIVSTKDPKSLRSVCDAQMLERYEMTGDVSKVVRINGTEVARYTVRVSKGCPEKKAKRILIDPEDAHIWIMTEAPQNYIEMYEQECAIAAKKIAEDYMLLEGELIEGAEVVEETVPAEPEHATGCMLKIDAEKMDRALKGETVHGLHE